MAIDNTASSTDGVRVISASFSAPTKSTLDVKTPKFVGGETIKVSNAESSEDCTISVTGGVATFSTTLTGILTAVYPSTAAKMNGDIIDQTAVLVSTVQDGTFAGANIAMATGITTSAIFTNKTAVIAITPGAGSNSNYVEVITAGPEIANDVPTGSAFTKLNKIHVNVNSATAYPVYVSILVPSGLKVKNLSFADGKNIKTAKDKATDIVVNTINTVNNTLWNTPYVEINGLKWATRNIGATADTGPDSYGTYFAWGDVNGQEADPKTGTSPIANAFDPGFGWSNYPYAVGGTSKFNKYVPAAETSYLADGFSGDTKTVLDLADDAANVNWGGSWRMPTIEEFSALASKTLTFSSGYYFGDSEENKIFLPAAGSGAGKNLSYANNFGDYWSSSLEIGAPQNAYCLAFFTGCAYEANIHRYNGYSVRALSE